MSRARLSTLTVLLVAYAAWLICSFGTAGGEPRNVTKVTAADLGSGRVIVVGRLGIPLMTMAKIHGTWHDREGKKGFHSLWFDVTHLNGEQLDKPVQFHRAVVDYLNRTENGSDNEQPSDGDSWEIQAFESGGFMTVPSRYYDEIPLPYPPTGEWTHDGFVTTITGVVKKWERPSKKKANPATVRKDEIRPE